MSMRPENQKMKDFLAENGIIATPRLIQDGSLKGRWSIYNKKMQWAGDIPLQQKMTELGFLDFDGKELTKFSGNGLFSIFAIYKGNNLELRNYTVKFGF